MLADVGAVSYKKLLLRLPFRQTSFDEQLNQTDAFDTTLPMQTMQILYLDGRSSAFQSSDERELPLAET